VKHVTTMELDGEVGKIMLPASSGMAQPQPQGASDHSHLDNRPTASPTNDGVDDVPLHLKGPGKYRRSSQGGLLEALPWPSA